MGALTSAPYLTGKGIKYSTVQCSHIDVESHSLYAYTRKLLPIISGEPTQRRRRKKKGSGRCISIGKTRIGFELELFATSSEAMLGVSSCAKPSRPWGRQRGKATLEHIT